MAMLPKSFNDADISDDIIPAGQYLAEITKSEMKDTKSGTGKYLSVGFKLLDGPGQGSMVYTNLNLVNDNDVAVQIANQTLAKICAAVGKDYKKITDSSELHAIPLSIKLTVRPPDDAFPGNEIKGYKSAGSKAPSDGIKKNPFKQ